MAADAFSSLCRRVICAARGHNWSTGTPLHGHDFCRRCKRYDDAPGMTVGRERWFRFGNWCPIWPHVSKTGAALRIGWQWKPINLGLRVWIRWAWGGRTDELPGFGGCLYVWRFRVELGVGSGWQDEDGERRSLVYLNVAMVTYGLRWIGCWLGHKPRASEIMGPGYLYCDRCDETLQTAERASQPTETTAA